MFLRSFKQAKARLCPRAGRRRGAGVCRRGRGEVEARRASRRLGAAEARPSGGRNAQGDFRGRPHSRELRRGATRSRGTEVYRFLKCAGFGWPLSSEGRRKFAALAKVKFVKGSRPDEPLLASRRLGESPAGRGRRRRRWPRRCGARRRHPARAWRAAAGRAARAPRVRTGAA